MGTAASEKIDDKPAHSHIGASSMHRWSACPGSVRLSANCPNTSSKYAEEGTIAHELGAAILTIFLLKEEAKGQAMHAAALARANEFYKGDLAKVNAMREAVAVYVLEVEKDAETSVHNTHMIEHRFDLSEIHPGLFGTADAVTIHTKKGLLRVYDYKHGAGIAVDVENNEQLKYYGLGALLSTGAKVSEVELVIVQPRCAHSDGQVRRWRFPAIDLIDFAADLSDFAKATEKPDAPLKSGDHCQFCPAKLICPVLSANANEAAHEAFKNAVAPEVSTDVSLPNDMPSDELSRFLGMIDGIKAWVKAVDEKAYREAMNGRPPKGYKLVSKKYNRKWVDPVRAETYLKEHAASLGIQFKDVLTEPELKSVKQVETVLPKEKKKLIAPLFVSISSGFALVPESDNRPAARMDAVAAFEKLSLEMADEEDLFG